VSARLRSACWPIAAVAWPALAGAQALPPTKVTIPKVAVAPTLEDYLPGGAMPGLKVTDFRQRQPKDLDTPTQPTAGYLSYDAGNLYVAFVCVQPRADVRAPALAAGRHADARDDGLSALVEPGPVVRRSRARL